MREAARHGLIAVTMDYRGLQIFPDDNGDGLPHSRGWNAITGAEDLIAAARLYESLCEVEIVTILGVSMGANMSGLAVAMAGERNLTKAGSESPLFDYWVDVEGSVNLVETYAAARLAAGADAGARNAQQDIEAETGGTFEQKPEEYRERTVVARVDDLEASGIKGAIVIHGTDDGLVPPNQSRELATLMREAGIITEMISIGRRDEDSERETTISGHVAGRVHKDYVSPLAGHASEKSSTHIVMQTALARLWSLMEGTAPVDRECFVNGQAPSPLARLCSP
jgi:dipeptidyl aminopeptidase/acylaminoacyl peptidase